ncbi:hypothetical protein AVEN_65257-1 [Araneus ventricosus]|uniref:RNase H type-1 domain-containing protein n=1 Tax=Araneus ventricosus TaxID=182803 RepID=A0A4Y2AHD1_ARAVE|nr:hypothetical protein AVEN_65257-1 [Araneus ventricosus]
MILIDQYGNKNRIIQTHLDVLENLTPLRTPTPSVLSNLYIECNRRIQALRAFCENVENYSRVFPPKVGKNWWIYAKREKLSEHITKLLTFLAGEVESDTAMEEIQNGTSDLNLLLTVASLKLILKGGKMTPHVRERVKTPGHAGIKWNEKADTLARRVSKSDLNIQWVTPEDIITQLKVHSGNQTDATYRGSKYYATLGDIPSIHSALVKE